MLKRQEVASAFQQLTVIAILATTILAVPRQMMGQTVVTPNSADTAIDAVIEPDPTVEDSAVDEDFAPREPPKFKPMPKLDGSWKPLGKDDGNKLWIHPKKKQVVVEGQVCLTRGYLEMFACVGDLKAHESVVGLNAKGFLIHTALVAVGAKPGKPSNWGPGGSYTPVSGTIVDVFVEWLDAKSNKMKRVKAQQWVRDLKTKRAMKYDWVFGGSRLWKDPETGRSYYSADSGDLICVSNFPTAMMDIPIESSQSNDDLAFEAFTENLPPRRTPIRLYLVPKLAGKDRTKSDGKKTTPKVDSKVD